MTIVVLADCPTSLRGDLSKWMIEINTGVYVGRLSARVRDALWLRICEHVKSGRATMVFRANNEQHMEFRVHNTTWELADYDGIKLLRRPEASAVRPTFHPPLSDGYSNAAHQQRARRMAKHQPRPPESRFVVIDLETTGLHPATDDIIEMAALCVEDGKVTGEYQCLVRTSNPLPPAIIELTGITTQVLEQDGLTLDRAIQGLLTFAGESTLVFHNATFDHRFLLMACKRCTIDALPNRIEDTLTLARRKLKYLPDYKLSTLAAHFGIVQTSPHRAMADCRTTCELYIKLNENG